MKVAMIFEEWKTAGMKKPYGFERMGLESGVFHSGTTFKCEIKLPWLQEEELRRAIKQGFRPCFYIDMEIGDCGV